MVAVLTYLYSLGGLHIPHIGDEAPYIQIVRLTAESDQWLPLRTPPGLENTKPPLLFWLGMVVTDWARQWTLFRLRFPITLFTFLTSWLVFLLARRVAEDTEAGYLAALSFLGFASTLQYGRPFLTNIPETLFAFLPFFLFIYFRDRIASWGISFWIGVGLSVGLACLFKSFVLIVPVGLAFTWCSLSERRWDFKAFLQRDAAKLATALLTGLEGLLFLDRNISSRPPWSRTPGSRIWLGHFANVRHTAIRLRGELRKARGHRLSARLV